MYTKELLDYVGNIGQIGGVKRYAFTSGRAKGVEAYDVDNGNGLLFTVLADRGMDIGWLSYRGMPVSFVSKTGVVSPFLYDGSGDECLRSFHGGFLTTCGLTQVGDPCVFQGRDYGLHGLVSNIPADEVCASTEWDTDAYRMRITGKVRQAKVQGEYLVLSREIGTTLGDGVLMSRDTITNEGSVRSPFMILYHINFGYPLLNPQCDVVLPSKMTRAWDDYSALHASRCLDVDPPAAGARELTYYHDVCSDAEGMSTFMVADSRQSPSVAVVVQYQKNCLPNLVQWKNLRKGEYVMALEPCNNLVRGIAHESECGTLRYLEPGESISIELNVSFLHDREQIACQKEKILKLNFA